MADLMILALEVGGHSTHLWHEGQIIGVQCQLMICRAHIKISKGSFQELFVVDSSMVELMSNSDFLLLSSFLV